jgi:hypothetical protein
MSYTEWLPFEEAFARPSSGAAWLRRMGRAARHVDKPRFRSGDDAGR